MILIWEVYGGKDVFVVGSVILVDYVVFVFCGGVGEGIIVR